jgi:hydroxymethylbilane synthase
MIMSACGYERVGLGHRITQRLSSQDGGIYHAVGQGALGLEVRKGDTATLALVNQLTHAGATRACLAERQLMRSLEGGCSVPIGVESEWVAGAPDTLRLRAIVVSLDGKTSVEESLERKVVADDEATALGEALAQKLVDAGASEILKAINADRPAKT